MKSCGLCWKPSAAHTQHPSGSPAWLPGHAHQEECHTFSPNIREQWSRKSQHQKQKLLLQHYGVLGSKRCICILPYKLSGESTPFERCGQGILNTGPAPPKLDLTWREGLAIRSKFWKYLAFGSHLAFNLLQLLANRQDDIFPVILQWFCYIVSQFTKGNPILGPLTGCEPSLTWQDYLPGSHLLYYFCIMHLLPWPEGAALLIFFILLAIRDVSLCNEVGETVFPLQTPNCLNIE